MMTKVFDLLRSLGWYLTSFIYENPPPTLGYFVIKIHGEFLFGKIS